MEGKEQYTADAGSEARVPETITDGAEDHVHHEARLIAYGDFVAPNGIPWCLTVREGAGVDLMARFCTDLWAFGDELVEQGWMPRARNAPLVWPLPSEEEKAEAERENFDRLVEEEALQQLPAFFQNQAKQALARLAVKAGIMTAMNDAAGGAKLLELGKVKGLTNENMGSRFVEWVEVITESMASKLPAGAPATGGRTSQPTAPRPPQQPAERRAEPQPQQGGVRPTHTHRASDRKVMAAGESGVPIPFDRIVIGGKKAAPVVEFWKGQGRQYAEATWKLGLDELGKLCPQFAELGLEFGDERIVGGTLSWYASENANDQGTRYINISAVHFN